LERAAGELRQVVTSTTAERDTLAAAVTVADTAAVAARADADRLEVERLALRADVETATARALAADAALAEARARIVALEQDITTATAAAAADADARTRAHGELQTRLQALETELADVTTARTTADRDLEESRRRVTELEQQVRAAGEQLAAVSAVMEQVRGAQDASVAPLQTAIGALERELTEARTQVTASDETARQAAVSVTRLQAELQTVRQADAGAMAALIAAHRGLIVDTMRRMVERETDRAKRAQTTAPKLRLWLDTFYEGHADLMRTALLPAIRVHLAFIRSSTIPPMPSGGLVDAHVAESRRQILTVLDGDADALAPSLDGLLYRWEQDRVTALADTLMEKELDVCAQSLSRIAMHPHVLCARTRRWTCPPIERTAHRLRDRVQQPVGGSRRLEGDDHCAGSRRPDAEGRHQRRRADRSSPRDEHGPRLEDSGPDDDAEGSARPQGRHLPAGHDRRARRGDERQGRARSRACRSPSGLVRDPRRASRSARLGSGAGRELGSTRSTT
jgi:hypothetical protein